MILTEPTVGYTKDAYYFSHDTNARNDEKNMYIISKYGISAYGIYWVLIECMHEQADGKLTKSLLEGYANYFRIDITLLNNFYNDAIKIGLFCEDDVKFWSDRVLRNKSIFNEKRAKKSENGKKGMLIRWGKDIDNEEVNNNTITTDNNTITKHNKVKESKVNESIEKDIDVFIKNELLKDFDSDIKEQYRLMWNMIKDVDAKHLINIPKPLTLSEYGKLRTGRTAEEVNSVIKSMMNAPGHFRGSKAKVSFYLTANDWLKIRTKPIKS